MLWNLIKSLLITLNRCHTLFQFFHWWLWASKCQLDRLNWKTKYISDRNSKHAFETGSYNYLSTLQKSGFALQMNFYLIIKNTNAHLVYLFFFFSLHFLTQLAVLLLFFLVFFFFEYFCLKKFSVNAIIRKQPQKGVFIDLSEITYFVELLNGCFETVLAIYRKS